MTDRAERGKGRNAYKTVKVQRREIDWRRKQEKARLHVLFINVEESVRFNLYTPYSVGININININYFIFYVYFMLCYVILF